MRKSEIYSNVIDIQKRTGQGLSGIVGRLNNDVKVLLDELVEEGLLKVNENTYVHLPNDTWYSPVTGYCVWDDLDKNALSFVRMFLGITEEIFLKLPYTHFVQNVDFMRLYSEWLTKNKEQLDVMLNLNDEYKGSDVAFTVEDIEHIKSRDWYEKNETIEVCLNKSKKAVSDHNEKIGLNKQLINLYKKSNEDYTAEIKACEEDILASEKTIKFRKRLHNYLETLENTLIQEVDFNI